MQDLYEQVLNDERRMAKHLINFIKKANSANLNALGPDERNLHVRLRLEALCIVTNIASGTGLIRDLVDDEILPTLKTILE